MGITLGNIFNSTPQPPTVQVPTFTYEPVKLFNPDNTETSINQQYFATPETADWLMRNLGAERVEARDYSASHGGYHADHQELWLEFRAGYGVVTNFGYPTVLKNPAAMNAGYAAGIVTRNGFEAGSKLIKQELAVGDGQ